MDKSKNFVDIPFRKSDRPSIRFFIQISDDFFLEKWGFFLEISGRETLLISEEILYFIIHPIFEFFTIFDKVLDGFSILSIDLVELWEDIRPEMVAEILCIRVG